MDNITMLEILNHGYLAFYLQYIASFGVWALVGIFSAMDLMKDTGYKPDRRKLFSKLTFIAACFYIAIQIHWVLYENTQHPGYVEWWWSVFETYVGAIILRCLIFKQPCRVNTRKQCDTTNAKPN